MSFSCRCSCKWYTRGHVGESASVWDKFWWRRRKCSVNLLGVWNLVNHFPYYEWSSRVWIVGDETSAQGAPGLVPSQDGVRKSIWPSYILLTINYYSHTHAARMVEGNSPTPIKKDIVAFLREVTSALSSCNWLSGHIVVYKVDVLEYFILLPIGLPVS